MYIVITNLLLVFTYVVLVN